MRSKMGLVRTFGPGVARGAKAGGGVACAAILGACMLSGESRIAHGYLYTSGNPTYDAFFRDVHQQQLDEQTWSDDRNGAHKALVASLDLTPDTPDVTIVQTTHESASKVAKQAGSLRLVDDDATAPHVVMTGSAGDGGALFHAIEDTARLELDRAKRLRAVEPRLDSLAKQAADLELHVKADFGKYGGGKETEVGHELAATKDAVAKLRAHAEAEARESEDFVADLGRALETASEDKRVEVHRGRPPRKREESVAPAASKKASASTPDQPPPPPRPAPPPPKPADPAEVFTP
jgi:hypothetical protein